jgi:hypothetical protein
MYRCETEDIQSEENYVMSFWWLETSDDRLGDSGNSITGKKLKIPLR